MIDRVAMGTMKSKIDGHERQGCRNYGAWDHMRAKMSSRLTEYTLHNGCSVPLLFLIPKDPMCRVHRTIEHSKSCKRQHSTVAWELGCGRRCTGSSTEKLADSG